MFDPITFLNSLTKLSGEANTERKLSRGREVKNEVYEYFNHSQLNPTQMAREQRAIRSESHRPWASNFTFNLPNGHREQQQHIILIGTDANNVRVNINIIFRKNFRDINGGRDMRLILIPCNHKVKPGFSHLDKIYFATSIETLINSIKKKSIKKTRREFFSISRFGS